VARELIEVERAREIVLDGLGPLPAEQVRLADALGRVLAEDVTSADAVPGFDNSAMDGFAVRSQDLADAAPGSPLTLRIVGESSAGHPADEAVGPGEAIRISTGAMLPDGADAIVRVEDAQGFDPLAAAAAGPEPTELVTEVSPEPGRDIRRAGEDIRPGDSVLSAGTAIGAAELGVLASVGRGRVSAARRPTLAMVSTGDELLGPEEEMRPGGVRNTNAWALPALARAAGAEVVSVGAAGDDADATRRAVDGALEADVAVICGGVSVGPHDHVRPALDELGAEQRFWGVALRPGRPTWFGVHGGGPAEGGALVFGLPGNPVSAIVTFLLFVRPALRTLSGEDPGRDRATAILDSAYEKGPGRTHAVRVSLRLGDDGWHAELTRAAQGSHVLTSMLGADALAVIPAAQESVPAGERVEVELLPRA
jgi:molybdopterin molybdotransferase